MKARTKSGALPIRVEPSSVSPEVGLLVAGGEVEAIVRTVRPDLWMKVEVGDAAGWLDGTDPRLELRREVTLRQGRVALSAQPGDRGAPLRVLRRQAHLCLLATCDEVGERWVRVRLPSGREGFVPGSTRVGEVDDLFDSLDGAPTFDPLTRWILHTGVLGGSSLLAVVGFFCVRILQSEGGIVRLAHVRHLLPFAGLGVVVLLLGIFSRNLGVRRTAAGLAPPRR